MLLLLGLALVAIEARWSADQRMLQLRLRRSSELQSFVEARSRQLAEQAATALVRAWREREAVPPVGAARSPDSREPMPRGREPANRGLERHTREEADRLDALVRETTRE